MCLLEHCSCDCCRPVDLCKSTSEARCCKQTEVMNSWIRLLEASSFFCFLLFLIFYLSVVVFFFFFFCCLWTWLVGKMILRSFSALISPGLRARSTNWAAVELTSSPKLNPSVSLVTGRRSVRAEEQHPAVFPQHLVQIKPQSPNVQSSPSLIPALTQLL